MIVFLFALFIVCLIGIRLSKPDEDYLSKEQTGAVRGIFTCIIFFSHLKQYITFEMSIDVLYGSILGYIGQLMVVIFFFYSGYGIAQSVQSFV